MPYSGLDSLPPAVKKLPEKAQKIWLNAFNSAYKQHDGDEEKAFKIAWGAVKNAGYETKKNDNFDIQKIDESNNLVFGWANVSVRKSGEQIVDYQRETIDIDDLEMAAYQFCLDFRETGEMHKGNAKGYLVESFVVTKQKLALMGLPEDSLPLGWWVGFYVPDDSVFAKIKDGTYKMFSIQGTGAKEYVDV